MPNGDGNAQGNWVESASTVQRTSVEAQGRTTTDRHEDEPNKELTPTGTMEPPSLCPLTQNLQDPVIPESLRNDVAGTDRAADAIPEEFQRSSRSQGTAPSTPVVSCPILDEKLTNSSKAFICL